jgi:hypothetical protein
MGEISTLKNKAADAEKRVNQKDREMLSLQNNAAAMEEVKKQVERCKMKRKEKVRS